MFQDSANTEKMVSPPFYFGENWNENCRKVLRYTETEAGYEMRRIERERAPFFEALQMRRTNYSFGTDAKHILELTKTSVIGMGSGEEHYAHRTDEQVRMFELSNASLVYFSLIRACRCDMNSGRPRTILPNRPRLRDYVSLENIYQVVLKIQERISSKYVTSLCNGIIC